MRKLLLFITLSVTLSNCKEEEQLAPLKPELELPSNNSTSTELDLTFSWKESSSSDSYTFQLSTQSDFSSIEVNKTDLSAVSINIEKLKPITTYYWRVNAENGAGVSPWSSTSTLTTKSLIVPTLLTPSDNSTQPIDNIQFSWNPISEASGYNLQISTKNDFSVLVTNQGNLTTATSTISGLVNSTNYYWRVSSMKNSSNSDWSTVRKFTTEPLGIPTLISPETNTKNLSKTVEFKWSSVSDASAYNLQVSTFDNFSSLVINKTNLSILTFSSADFKWNTKYYWRVNAMAANCQSEWSEIRNFTTELPTEGLVAWYPFNGNATDESGNAHNGTPKNGPILTTDRNGSANKAYSFDGIDDYISVPHHDELNLLGNFTVSAWYKSLGCINPCDQPGYHTIIMKRDVLVGPGDDWPWGLGISYLSGASNTEFKKIFATRRSNTIADYRWTDKEISINTWQHAVIIVQNGKQSIYINGVLDSSSDFTLTQLGNTKNMNIGWSLRPGFEQFKGEIDDIRLYNIALTIEEIVALYNE